MADKIAIAVCGAGGKMGQAILRQIGAEPGLELCAAWEREGHPWIGRPLREVCPEIHSALAFETIGRGAAPRPQVVIDFSAPPALAAVLAFCQSAGCAALIGSTGLGPEEERLLAAAEGKIACLHAANMARGISLLVAWLPKIAAALPGYDIALHEVHHRQKKDAPSGTAKRLAGLLERAGHSVQISAARGGDVFGEHTLSFLGPGERIEIVHRASSRELFARGALAAARWLVGKPAGRYGIEEVYGLR
jgi:4-hydroxy-tetrahydrodipicolinate reductase